MTERQHMQTYLITILGHGDMPYDLYIRGRRGLSGEQVAAAWNRRRPTRCVAVRDARTHRLLWSASAA